jgi:hypothetical protein
VTDGDRAMQKARARLPPGLPAQFLSITFYIRITLRLSTDVELYFAEICLAEKFCIARAAAIIPPEKARKNKAKKFLLDLRYVNGA